MQMPSFHEAGAYLINVARAELVDEKALTEPS